MAARVTAFVVIAIVAVTFVAGLIVGAQKEDDSGPVDLIVYNARVYTGSPDDRFAEAIAIRGNRIIRVGSNRDVKRLMRRATTVIDAHGGTVTAGFRDGNVDLKAGGLTLAPPALLPVAVSEDDAPSAPGTPAAAAAAATSTSVPSSPSASVPGTAPEQTVAGSETGDTLDLIQQAIRHANTVGVTSVGVTARTPDDLLPYDTLLRTRELTARVNAALAAEWPLDEAAVARLDALRKRYEGVPLFKLKAVRLRVTDGEPAAAIGRKKPAKSAKVAHAVTASAAPGAAAAAGTAVAVADAAAADRVEALSRTIALLEQHNWQIILETKDAGDAALALDAIEASLRASAAAGATAGAAATAAAPEAATTATGSAAKAAGTLKHRVRLEVGAMLDQEAVARLTRLNVIASAPKPFAPPAASVVATSADATPAIATSAVATSGTATSGTAASGTAAAPVTEEATDAKALAPQDSALFEAMTRPYANLLASAAPFVLFSAWPATPIDPRVALHLIMLDGVLLAGKDTPPDADTLTERLARAIDACTRYAAFAAGEEDQQGTIAKEMLADLVIFSADIFALPPDKVMDAEITTTIFDGKVIYTRPEPTADTSSE